MSINRREWLKGTALGAAGLSMGRRAQAAAPPNIVLIVSDDQGYRDLGCYGSDEAITPNMDRIASGGVKLSQFYVTWPACTPSRGSLLTGRYPQRNGTYDMYRNDKPDYGYLYPPEEYETTPERILGMDTREILLPKLLKQAGYQSGIFGKWDLGQLHRFLPLQRGFDRFYGFVNTGIDYYKHERYGVHAMYRDNHPTKEDYGAYCTDLFKREALRFIEENHRQPFFCYLPFNAPHIASVLEKPKPVHAPEQYKAMYPKPGNQKEELRRDHLASITAMDDAIGEVLEALEEKNVADNTIVIFMSDNGGSGNRADNGPLRGGKGTMFEGGLRVPCMVRWPGEIQPGTECDAFLSSMDILPMICQAAGARIPEGLTLDGFDMKETLKGRKPSERNTMAWKRRGDIAVRSGDWKWIDSEAGKGLFNLKSDIGETRDLSNEAPGVLAMMRETYAQWKHEMDNAEPRRPFKDF